jgi:hypothetical protein
MEWVAHLLVSRYTAKYGDPCIDLEKFRKFERDYINAQIDLMHREIIEEKEAGENDLYIDLTGKEFQRNILLPAFIEYSIINGLGEGDVGEFK